MMKFLTIGLTNSRNKTFQPENYRRFLSSQGRLVQEGFVDSLIKLPDFYKDVALGSPLNLEVWFF